MFSGRTRVEAFGDELPSTAGGSLKQKLLTLEERRRENDCLYVINKMIATIEREETKREKQENRKIYQREYKQKKSERYLIEGRMEYFADKLKKEINKRRYLIVQQMIKEIQVISEKFVRGSKIQSK